MKPFGSKSCLKIRRANGYWAMGDFVFFVHTQGFDFFNLMVENLLGRTNANSTTFYRQYWIPLFYRWRLVASPLVVTHRIILSNINSRRLYYYYNTQVYAMQCIVNFPGALRYSFLLNVKSAMKIVHQKDANHKLFLVS